MASDERVVIGNNDFYIYTMKSRLNMTKHEEDRPIDATSEEMQRIDGHLSTQSEKSVVPEVAVDILEAIIESTYAMYANAFHYANVSAAFVQPIEVHLQQLPYTLKPPRPVRLPTLFPVITDTPEKGTAAKNRSKIDKEKPAKNKEREKSVEIQPSLPVLTDEEIIDQKRSRILPLMESNEAPHMLQQFSLSSMSTSAITEISVKKKGKKKAS